MVVPSNPILVNDVTSLFIFIVMLPQLRVSDIKSWPIFLFIVLLLRVTTFLLVFNIFIQMNKAVFRTLK